MAAMSYDLIVIGAGSGGLAAARRAAKYGAKVVIVENGRVGGTCVNVGCVPKKIMWSAASMWQTAESANFVDTSDRAHGKFDWAKVKQGRDAYIQRLNNIYKESLRKEKIEMIEGTAVLGKLQEVVVNGNQIISGKHILIATGSLPVIPKDVPGHELGTTSDGFFELTHQPKNVAIVGSGYIAAELSGIFSVLGSTVHIWCRQDRIMTRFDKDIACRLQDEMERSGRVTIHKKSNVTKITKDSSGLLTI
jgi:glutathione reductase (NADPH)